jgi:hypothetical protein
MEVSWVRRDALYASAELLVVRLPVEQFDADRGEGEAFARSRRWETVLGANHEA